MLGRVWRNRNPPVLLGEMQVGVATIESSIEGPLKAKNRATIWPSSTTPGIDPEKMGIQKDACTSVFKAALSAIARTWRQPKCPSTAEWIKKMWSIYTVEYYSAVKGNETVPFAEMCIDLEIITQSEVIQKEKNKCTNNIIYM